MIKEILINIAMLAAGIVLFCLTHGVMTRVCLVLGWVLLMGVVNYWLGKLSVKKDANGNPLYTYYVSFEKETDKAKGRKILAKMGEVGDRTEKFMTLTTTMKLKQAENRIRSDMKISPDDFQIIASSFSLKQ